MQHTVLGLRGQGRLELRHIVARHERDATGAIGVHKRGRRNERQEKPARKHVNQRPR